MSKRPPEITPGDWISNGLMVGPCSFDSAGDPYRIEPVCYLRREDGRPIRSVAIDIDNGRVLAAAPRLYEKLGQFVRATNGTTDSALALLNREASALLSSV